MRRRDSRPSGKSSVSTRANDRSRVKSPNTRSNPVASIHRAAGNQAVQRAVENRSRGRSPDGPSIRERTSSEGVQPKLEVGDPNSKYEREAEHVADQVMRMAEPTVDTSDGVGPAQIQRMCPRCQQRFKEGKPLNCPDCEKELQRSAQSPEVPAEGDAVADRIQSVRGGGRPLDDSVRSFLEPRFGQDFSDVRVHTGTQADEAARSVNATAFTLGTDVVFRSGAYRPGTSGGKRLLAHELTHVVQQRGERPKADDGSSERASGMVQASDAPPSIQRSCKNGTWQYECDGCSMPPKYQDMVADKDNPTGHPETVFGNESPNGLCKEDATAPCDEHDRCYQTCHSERTEDGWQYDMQHKSECDLAFYHRMMAVCEDAGDPEGAVSLLGWNPDCTTFAEVYYQAVSWGGDEAYEQRQREACECAAREPEKRSEPKKKKKSRDSKKDEGPVELEPTKITGNVITVARGDTLWDIAEREYGDGRKWRAIYEENKKGPQNPNGIEDPDLIYPGQRLIIPSKSEAKAFEKQKRKRAGKTSSP